jgi:hypothetical protein
MFRVVAPIIHDSGAIAGTKVISPENMITDVNNSTEDYQGGMIKADLAPDIWALHDYMPPNYPFGDESTYRDFWEGTHARSGTIPLWQTEDAGYRYDNWADAIGLAMKMAVGMKYSHFSAWLWWQLGDDADPPETMALWYNGFPLDGKVSVFKHWARYVRPGAVQVGAFRNPDRQNRI